MDQSGKINKRKQRKRSEDAKRKKHDDQKKSPTESTIDSSDQCVSRGCRSSWMGSAYQLPLSPLSVQSFDFASACLLGWEEFFCFTRYIPKNVCLFKERRRVGYGLCVSKCACWKCVLHTYSTRINNFT